MREYKQKLPKIRLVKEPSDFNRSQITASGDVFDLVKKFYDDDIEICEKMFAIFLNRANNTVGFALVSQGGISGTVCDVRLICKLAIDILASGVIIVHNHPSGNDRPSTSDNDVCKKVKSALTTLDMNLLDFMIVTNDKYYSYADEGIL